MTASQANLMLQVFYQAEVESRQRTFIFDSEMERVFECLSKTLTSDNSKFGILLCGECGNGKTTFLYAIQNLINWLNTGGYFKNPDNVGMQIKSAREIAFLSRQDYSKFLETARYPKILAIDDMGEEPYEVLDYGNIYNPVVELIELRYNNQLTTFITSNLDPEEIREKYHIRISDRLREMVEQIVFENESYR